MKNNIVFYHHFSNGDIFSVKYYIKQIMSCLPNYNFYYAHYRGDQLIKDLDIQILNLMEYPYMDNRQVFIESDNTIFINTWIGHFIDDNNRTNWKTYHGMFEFIYARLSEMTGVNIPLLPMEKYIPDIDYSKFDIPHSLKTDYDNTIIFSNGPVVSFQSNLKDNNTDFIVKFLLEAFPDKKLILTHECPIVHDNIMYTSEIINKVGSDLNEISYIADKHCKYIIGRNSGPFHFMNTKNILFNSDKNIISMGNCEGDKIIYNMDIEFPCNYVYLDDRVEEDILLENIRKAWQ